MTKNAKNKLIALFPYCATYKIYNKSMVLICASAVKMHIAIIKNPLLL